MSDDAEPALGLEADRSLLYDGVGGSNLEVVGEEEDVAGHADYRAAAAL